MSLSVPNAFDSTYKSLFFEGVCQIAVGIWEVRLQFYCPLVRVYGKVNQPANKSMNVKTKNMYPDPPMATNKHSNRMHYNFRKSNFSDSPNITIKDFIFPSSNLLHIPLHPIQIPPIWYPSLVFSSFFHSNYTSNDFLPPPILTGHNSISRSTICPNLSIYNIPLTSAHFKSCPLSSLLSFSFLHLLASSPVNHQQDAIYPIHSFIVASTAIGCKCPM